MFRGTYGAYPRRFKQKMLDLTSDVLVLRPFWYNPNRKQMTIAERVLSAHVRPRKFKTDWNVRAAVEYAPGLRLEWAGFEVISCDTSSGTLEFAVPRPDIPLVLHVLQRQHHQPQQDTPGEHT